MYVLRFSKTSLFTLSSLLRRLSWIAAVRQKLLCSWASAVLTVVGKSHLVSSFEVLVFDKSRVWSSLLETVHDVVSILLIMPMLYSDSLPLSKFSSWTVLCNYNIGSVAWCYITAWHTTPNSNFENLRRFCASCPVESVKFRIRWTLSWSVRFLKRLLSRYRQVRSSVRTAARHSCCSVLYCCSFFVSGRDQPKGFSAWFSCVCRRTQQTFTSHD